VVDEGCESQRRGDPESRRRKCCVTLGAAKTSLAARVDQFGGEEQKQREMKADPVTERRYGHESDAIASRGQRWLMRRMDSKNRSREICSEWGLSLSSVSCAVWW